MEDDKIVEVMADVMIPRHLRDNYWVLLARLREAGLKIELDKPA